MDFIDFAHVLPHKKDETPPVIVRLRSKSYKTILMKYKAAFFKTASVKFSIVDDLTRANAQLLKATKEREDVLQAWYRNGKIRFKLKSDPDKLLTA